MRTAKIVAVVVMLVLAPVVIVVGQSPGTNALEEPAEPERFVVAFQGMPRDMDRGDTYKGGVVIDVNRVIHFAVVETGSPTLFRNLAESDERVRYVEPEMTYQALFTPNDPRFTDQFGPDQIDLPEAWDTTLGDTSKTICVADTGVRYTHEDLNGPRWLGGHDFVNDDSDPFDDEGHGTHVTGIAAATTDNATGIAGAAQVGFLHAKVGNATGSILSSHLADGITWCADNGGDVISLSLGGPSPSKVIHDAVQYAEASGSLVVAAAGNDGTSDDIDYPAKFTEAIAVTCTNNESLCFFSDTGPESELAAPGSGILSTYFESDTSYERISGTSMSTPFVSGVAALVWSHNNSLTNTELRRLLRDNAQDLGDAGRDNLFGYGEVDANATINSEVPELPEMFQLHFEDFDDGAADGWTTETLWHVSDACETPPSTPNYLGYNEDSDCEYSTGAQTFGSAYFSVNLTDTSRAKLAFDHLFEVEDSQDPVVDVMRVFVSIDGGSTFRILDRWDSRDVTNAAWTSESYSLDLYTGNEVLVLFDFNSVDEFSNNHSGWFIDDVEVTANALDHVRIEHQNGTAVGDLMMTTDESETFFARGYDATGNLLRDVEVAWNTTGDLDAVPEGPTTNVTFSPSTGNTSGTITANHTDLAGTSDGETGTITVEPGDLDNLRIEHQNGTAVDAVDMTTDDTETFYARGYDAEDNLIGDVDVTWDTTGDLDTVAAGPTTSVTFDPSTAGTSGTITANRTDVTGDPDDATGTITVEIGEFDHLLIEHQNGTEIGSQTLTTDDTLDLYTRGYDADNNLIGDAQASWDTTGDLDPVAAGPTTEVTFSPSTADTNGTITADNATLTGSPDDATGQIDVTNGTLDHLRVEYDNGTVVGDHTMTTDDTLTVFARGYDADDNLLGDFQASWNVTGSLDPVPEGPSTSVTFDPSNAGTTGTITVNRTDVTGDPDNATGTITVEAGAIVDFDLTCPASAVVNTTFTCEAKNGLDADGNDVPIDAVDWTIDDGSLHNQTQGGGTFFANLTAPTDTDLGPVTVEATASDADGAQTTNTSDVALEPGPLDDANLTCPDTAEVATTFTCSVQDGVDAFGNDVTLDSATWSATDTNGDPVTLTDQGLSADVDAPEQVDLGPVTVETTASDADGNPTTNATDVTLEPGPLADLNLTCPASTVVNATFGCDAQDGVDQFGNNVTLQDVTWTISEGTLEGTSQTGDVFSADFEAPTDTSLSPIDVTATGEDDDANSVDNTTSVALDPAAASQLGFTVQPPGQTIAGETWDPFTVGVQDEFGNLVPDDGTTAVTIDPGPNATGNLSGTLTRTVSSGTATFDDVAYDAAENITVVAGNASLADATSDEIEVLTGNLSYVQIEFANSPEVGNLSMTTDDTETFAARGYDDEDNFVAEIEVTWDTIGTLDPVPAGPSKRLTFDPVTADTSGNVTAEHTSENVTGDETGTITVAVGALADLELNCPGSVTVNRTDQCQASNGTDADGNDRSIVDVNWSISDGSLGEQTNESGVFFANFTAPTDTGLGPLTVEALGTDDGGNATTNASEVELEPDDATQLGFETQPPSTVTVDATWSTFTVGVQDRFGNLVPDNQTAFVNISASGGASTELAGTLNGTVTDGTVDFDDVSYPAAETITVLAGNASLDNATSNDVDVQEEDSGDDGDDGGNGSPPSGDDGETEEEEEDPQGPTAAVSASCPGLTCTFDASASQAGDAQIQSYSWTFGDGSSGSGQTTTHTYADADTYTVTLDVTDGNGLSDSASTTVVLTEALSAEVALSPASPAEDDEVEIQVEVTNVGDVPVDNETVEILLDGSLVHQETIDLAVGASETIQAALNADGGDHTLRVEAAGLLDAPIEETFQVSEQPGSGDGGDDGDGGTDETTPGPSILAAIAATGAAALLVRRRRR